MWTSPTVSPDGRYIAAVTDCYRDCPPGGESRQIALLDLSKPDVNYTFLTKGEKYRDSPIFTPDGMHVVFMIGQFFISDVSNKKMVEDYGFSMIPISGGDEIELAPSEKGKDTFYVVGSPYFVGKERIAFSAIPYRSGGPNRSGGPIAAKADSLGKSAVDEIGLTLQFGSQGEGYALMPENKSYTMSNLTASLDGDIVFIDLNENEPESESHAFQYELFMSHKGEVTQLTNIKSFLHTPSISGDGSRVVFLEDKSMGTTWEIMLLDVASGRITDTGIREKIIEQLRLEQLKNE